MEIPTKLNLIWHLYILFLYVYACVLFAVPFGDIKLYKERKNIVFKIQKKSKVQIEL